MSEVIWPFDTETHRIGPGNIAPPIICLSTVLENEEYLISVGDEENLDAALDIIFEPEDASIRLAHNTAFDLSVIVRRRPDLLPPIFEMLSEGQIQDTIIREKLLNLTEHGKLTNVELPNGASKRIDYKLSTLEKDYLGIDRSEEKQGEDAWRTNYAELERMPSDQWPEEAREYALADSRNLVDIYRAQEDRRAEILRHRGVDPFETLAFRCSVDFALKIITCAGFRIDPEEKAKIEAMLQEELKPENLNLLIEENILRPGKPAEPYKNGAKDHVEGCEGNDCDCPVKMKQPVKESKNKKRLHEYVMALAEKDHRVRLKYNDPTENEIAKAEQEGREPQGNLSVDSAWLEEYAGFDPVLQQYKRREELQKLVTTELPRMCFENETGELVTAKVVHPCFDVLKETGRTSSYADKLYPSFNGQNVDPRVRQCYIARPGYVLFSADYDQMELVTLAQTCLSLFGSSVLADKINKGMDPHAYLGASLARHLDSDFAAHVQDLGLPEGDATYEEFIKLKTGDEDERAFFKHYRTFAKPTGLGYPGGLGAGTFCTYAKGTFGVEVSVQEAEELKNIWKHTFPEMEEYFNYINRQCDDTFIEDKYFYTSPMGMYRAGASYCAAANGMGLQTPGAEGALLAVWNVVRSCYDTTMKSILGPDEKGVTTRPLNFVHDEIIGEIREDNLMQERLDEINHLMVSSMREITPDINVKAEAVLMRRWDKSAEAVFDENGRIQVWEGK